MIVFTVSGVPATAGSKTAQPIRRGGALVIKGQRIVGNQVFGHPVITMRDSASEKQKTWIPAVKKAATAAWRTAPLQDQALVLSVMFHMPRPKDHYRTGKFKHLLKDDAPKQHLQKPDSTKLLRCLEDACTGLLWADDCVVISTCCEKKWADGRDPGADVFVALA